MNLTKYKRSSKRMTWMLKKELANKHSDEKKIDRLVKAKRNCSDKIRELKALKKKGAKN